MYTNDLHNAYEYERERRNDERRAAAESLQTRGLSGSGISLPIKIAGIAIVVVALIYEL